ncbi:MAG: PTS sugar transporter subunit IIA [Planctomycetota bacterium]|jgi:mannitol/fructose-specific phosphotransferase system IIA component (Ntr-type)|nr:PTS sugar transporter subunit IIA [Planctomycetota bacterium]
MSDTYMSDVIVDKVYVALPSDADKRTVISKLAEALASARKIKAGDLENVVEGAMAREAIGSTGIGHGIAIPHCRTDLVKNIVCAYGHCSDGVDFDSLDGEPVHSVFLLLTPHDKKDEHLALMKNFASQIRKDHFCDFLQQSTDPKSLVALLSEFEDQ